MILSKWGDLKMLWKNDPKWVSWPQDVMEIWFYVREVISREIMLGKESDFNHDLKLKMILCVWAWNYVLIELLCNLYNWIHHVN